MGELPDQPARRVDQQRKPFGEIGARGEFGMRDQAGQHAVEQIDVIGAEIRQHPAGTLADPARGIGAAFGVVAWTISSSPGISAVAGVISLSKPAVLAGFSAI